MAGLLPIPEAVRCLQLAVHTQVFVTLLAQQFTQWSREAGGVDWGRGLLSEACKQRLRSGQRRHPPGWEGCSEGSSCGPGGAQL